ncbi:MAG TPA: hypothetical protein VMC03_21225 [Streptosporangiaceae bacterium]|nr:hypothetical protein [Streptosporangiaceae bacterium]
MRIRFTRAGYALAAGVAVTAMLGMSAASAAMASSTPKFATNACGSNCVDIHFLQPGKHAILGVHSGYDNNNNLVRLLAGSNGLSKEDFSEIHSGKISSQYCVGSVPYPGSVFTARQCQLLKLAGLTNDYTFELAFNPNNGGPENMCVGAWSNTSPIVDGKLRLVPCGVEADTVLIRTQHLPTGHTTAGSYWLINGASDNYSNPLVITSDGTYPSQPRWETVDVNAGHGIDTQEVRITPGPFIV